MVEINCLYNNCPLCGKYFSETPAEIEYNYPDMSKVPFKQYTKKMRLFLFFLITSSIILFTVNILTFDKTLWCVVPISAIWLLLPMFGIPLAKKKISPLMIVLDNLVVCIFLVIVDLTVDKQEWAMSYVVPFVLSGSAFIVTAIVLLKKMTWRELYLFQLSIAAICFIPIMARIFFTFVFWPSIVSAVYGLITIIAMLIFSDKGLKFESRKRFHY
jgi:hypothetical protein